MKCTKTAEYLCPWAGKQVKACKEHAEQLAGLASIIGSPMQVAKVTMLDECDMEQTPKE